MSYVSPIKIGYEAEPEEGWTDKIGKYLAGEVDNLVLQSCVKVGCHVDKDELEKALRYDRGQYEKGYEDGKREAAAAIEALQADQKKTVTQIFGEEQMAWEGRCKDLMYQIADLQAQLPKRGEWKTTRPDAPMFGFYYCSICGRRRTSPQDNYCPNCGAKMEVQE